MLSESVRDICMTSPELLANLEIAEFCYWTRKQFFWQSTDKIFEKINYCYSAITQLIQRKLQYIVIKILRILNVMLYKQWNKRSLHIYVPIINQTVFIFGHLATNPPFWTQLSSVHGRVMQLFGKNKLRFMCNSPRIMKFSSHQIISSRSGSSEMESVTCQNGHRPFPQLFAQFCMAWRY